MRGKYASKPIEQVVAEARQLAADGVRELVIVAQDTTYYGIDLYGQPRLAELLDELEAIDGARLDSADVPLSDVHRRRLIDLRRRRAARSLPYLDLPLQHISDTMLARDAPAREPRRNRAAARTSSASGSRTSCCGRR